MKNLILDVNVVLDLWLARGNASLIEAILERSATGEVRFWVAATSLPILHYVCAAELKKRGASGADAANLASRLTQSLLDYVSVLSVQGFQQRDLLSRAKDLEDAQIAAAATALHGETRILSNDASFDGMGAISILSPSAALAWLDEARPPSTVDFIDLKTQQDRIRPQLEEGVHRVLRHGQYILGPEVGELEGKLAEYVGVKHCIGVSSGYRCLAGGHVGARYRAWGRGHHEPLHLHRHRRNDCSDWRRAGLCGHRRPHLQHRSGQDRGRHHTEDPSDHACQPLRAMRGHGRHQRSRRASWSFCDRGRRPKLRCDLQGAPVLRLVAYRLHQLLSFQALGWLRRCRRLLYR